MKFSDHQKKENLKQLTDAWKYLTPFQRKRIVWVAKFYFLKKKISLYIPRLPSHRPPRLGILLAYTYILFIVTSTVIMIASQNLQLGIILFGAFVIPLYALIGYSSKYGKRIQTLNQFKFK